MSRSPVIHLAIVTALLWQALAFASVGSALTNLLDSQHLQLHWHGESHHHHQDGSYDTDGGSGDATEHSLLDHSGTSPMLVMAPPPAVVALGLPTLNSAHVRRVPEVTLYGHFRPPRSHT